MENQPASTTPSTPKTNALRAEAARPLRVGLPISEYEPTPARQKAVRRASEIAKALYAPFGLKYTARNKPRILQRQAVALYENHSGVDVTRTRTHQDVNVYSHEIRHTLFDRVDAFKKTASL